MDDVQDDGLGFLRDGGEMGRLIARFDWSATDLGPVGGWPASLRVAVGIMLRSPLAMVVLWGRDGIMLYNDPYAVVAGGRHPAALGSKPLESWPEIADFNRHVLDVCLAGGVLSFRDQRMTLFRNGVAEDVWLDLTYSPLTDENGTPVGVLAVVVETTERNLNDERLRIAQAAGRFGAFEWFPDQRRVVASDAYRHIYGLSPDIEVTDTLLLSLIPPEDLDRTGHRKYAYSANPLTYSEYRVRHMASGELRWVARRGEILEGGSGVARRFIGVAWDITERKRAESHDSFLAALSDRLRDLGDPDALVDAATRLLGGYLGVGRVGYGEIDAAGNHLTVTRDWTDAVMPSLAGRLRLADFGAPIARAFHAGETVRIDDTEQDGRLAEPGVRDAFARIGMRAGIAVPLIREGRLIGALYAHSAGPRHWDDRDEAVLHEVAERTWDATQRARAERRLRESEEKFRQFAQVIPNQVWSANPEGQLDWFNAQVYAYSGAAPGALDGDRWAGMVHPDDVPAAVANWATALRDGSTYQTEFRLRRADGVWRWHIARALPIRGAGGEVTRWVGSNTDIEDQRRALADLARLNATLEERVEERTRERDRIWTLSRDPLLITDQDGRWLAASPAWTTLLGWSRAELLGRTAAWMGHPDDPPFIVGEAGRLASSTPTDRFENRFRARDGGYRWFSWTAVSDDGLLYCVARDITAEKAAALRLHQTEEALRQAQKMEAIGQLTGGIAHDFNNLLTGILGSLDLLRRRIAAGRTGELDRFMDAAITSAQRAAALTHRLLAFARRQPLDSKPVAVDALVRDMEELLLRTLGEQVSLHIALAPATWHALCDPNQLESAILNLAINARDAMPGGGQLTIETANATLDTHYTGAHQGLEPGDYVAICVTDTGTGMPRAVVEKAFEPFFTTKPVGQGTGLGLSMVYGFARQSGGHVRIYSEPGQGAAVKLYLPRADARADATPPAAAGAPLGSGEVVLVIEDDPSVRLLIGEVLRELGYTIREAGDAAEALPIIASSAPLDLMVTDVGLPGMNGRQLADFARARRPRLKVLFVTGYAENAAVRSGFLDPGMAMITKPFAIDALAEKIRDMMALA
jgi:PAS domain S-box-containing protein